MKPKNYSKHFLHFNVALKISKKCSKLFSIFCRSNDELHAQEVSKFQEDLSEAQSQIQILQKRLDEELAKQPLTNQEVTKFVLRNVLCKYMYLF